MSVAKGSNIKSLIPLERVEGVELGRVFLEELREQQVLRKLHEVYNLSCICKTQNTNAVIKLWEAGSNSFDSKLSFSLIKLDMIVLSPELGKLESYWVYTQIS